MKRRFSRKRRLAQKQKKQSLKKIQTKDFQITYDDEFNPYDFEIAEEINNLLAKYESICLNHPRKAVIKLRAMIKTFPHIPQFKNYLVTALKLSGRMKEAYQVNDHLLEEHPDYLFAITNKVIQYLETTELDKIPALLGGEPISLTRTFPKRKLFYVMEVFNYYKVLLYYWTTIGEVEKAEEAFTFLEDIQPGDAELIGLQRVIRIAKLKKLRDKLGR